MDVGSGFTGTLNEAQWSVLNWIADGCRDEPEGHGHRISAVALRSRGLVAISGRGKTWRATLTDAGRRFLQDRGVSALAEPASESVRPPDVEPHVERPPARTKAPRPLGKYDRFIRDIVDAGGELRIQGRYRDESDVYRLVEATQRYGKVPHGKRLTRDSEGSVSVVRLQDSIPGTLIDPVPVSIPERISKRHATARQFADLTDRHEISQQNVARIVAVVHALATEAARRGYSVSIAPAQRDEYRREIWSGSRDGHLLVTIHGHLHRIRLRETGIKTRGEWEREARWRRSLRGDARHGDLPTYDAKASGRVTLTIDGGYAREGRQATWTDGTSTGLEDHLPAVLRELEIRAAEQDYRAVQAQLARQEREQQWHSAMERARELYAESQRADALRTQVGRWQEAEAINAYCDALVDRHGAAISRTEWVTWARAYAAQLSPAELLPTMPATREPKPDELKPFLRGMSPHGPHQHR